MDPLVSVPQQEIAPALLSAQLCSRPALTAIKPVPDGALACPNVLLPQQEIAPVLRNAQVCSCPALTAVKLPDGAVVRLFALFPQQAIVPVLRRAHVCDPPALTAVNVVGVGGSGVPGSGICGSTVGGRATVDPSGCVVGCAVGSATTGGGVRPPQQETPRSRIAQLWRLPALTLK